GTVVRVGDEEFVDLLNGAHLRDNTHVGDRRRVPLALVDRELVGPVHAGRAADGGRTVAVVHKVDDVAGVAAELGKVLADRGGVGAVPDPHLVCLRPGKYVDDHVCPFGFTVRATQR